MRLIDADKIPYTMLYKEDWLKGSGFEAQGVWKKDIDAMPTIEPERTGRWIDDGSELGTNLAEVGTWTYRNGEPLTGGVCESDIIYCSRCHKPTHVKIHTWIENGMKYGKAINVRECPNCGARMER